MMPQYIIDGGNKNLEMVLTIWSNLYSGISMHEKEDPITIMALILVIIGGINWGLASAGLNLVRVFLGRTVLARLVYAAVGLAALYLIIPLMGKLSRQCPECKEPTQRP